MAAPRQKERRRPVLIIQHAQYEHPAAIRRAIESQGIVALWIHPYQGDAYPKIDDVRGVISLGGPMGANDDQEHPWIPAECALLREATLMNLPIAGVCLGGQLLARALGGHVTPNVRPEVGWFPIRLNAEGRADAVLRSGGETPVVYQWHQDTFHLPPEAVLLAENDACERQAYRVGEHAYGFQFHPEADHQLVHEWLALRGVDEELSATRREHGARTIQNADTQRNRAEKGEKSSLRISTAISQLFRDRDYEPVGETLREQIADFIAHRTLVILEVEGSYRRPRLLRGHVTAIVNLPFGEFLFLREEGGVLWPVRLDFVKKLMLA